MRPLDKYFVSLDELRPGDQITIEHYYFPEPDHGGMTLRSEIMTVVEVNMEERFISIKEKKGHPYKIDIVEEEDKYNRQKPISYQIEGFRTILHTDEDYKDFLLRQEFWVNMREKFGDCVIEEEADGR